MGRRGYREPPSSPPSITTEMSSTWSSAKGYRSQVRGCEALGVHGWNDDQEVADFIKWAGFDADEIVNAPSLTEAGKHESRTVFQTLQPDIDIFGKPPKRFYEELGKVGTTRRGRWLRFISSAEGSATFKKLSEIETLTYADVCACSRRLVCPSTSC